MPRKSRTSATHADLSALTGPQAALLAALCTGKTTAAAASSIGMPIRTARRHLGDPLFRACLVQTRRESMRAATMRLADLCAEAVETVAQIMRDPSVAAQTRLHAARSILDAGTDYVANADTERDLERSRAKEEGLVLPDDEHETPVLH